MGLAPLQGRQHHRLQMPSQRVSLDLLHGLLFSQTKSKSRDAFDESGVPPTASAPSLSNSRGTADPEQKTLDWFMKPSGYLVPDIRPVSIDASSPGDRSLASRLHFAFEINAHCGTPR